MLHSGDLVKIELILVVEQETPPLYLWKAPNRLIERFIPFFLNHAFIKALRLSLIHIFLETWSLEICTRITIVHIRFCYVPSLLFHIIREDGFLCRNARTLVIRTIVFR